MQGFLISKKREECYGCTACYSVCPKNCIKMEEDNEGFEYPKIDFNKCIKCKKCEKICPIVTKNKRMQEIVVYAAYIKNDNIRNESTSGGVYSALVDTFCKENYVIFGVTYDEKLNVIHDCITDIEELYKFRGAKYVQSKMGETYKNIKKSLNENKNVFFSGTPCQVSGLKSYLNKEYKNLFCCDIVCHGVPSPKVFIKYKNYVQDKNGKIKMIRFRDKSIGGWNNPNMKISFEEKKEINENLRSENLYGNGFGKNIFLRPSCHKCKFCSLNRSGDISLGDFWGIENYSKMDTRKGVSLIILNSEKGKNLFNRTKNLYAEKHSIEKAIVRNPNLLKPSSIHLKRKNFFSRLETYEFDKLHKKYIKKIPFFIRLKNRIPKEVKEFIRKKIRG